MVLKPLCPCWKPSSPAASRPLPGRFMAQLRSSLSRFLSFLLHLNFHSPSPKSQRSHLVISQPVRPKSLALLTQGCYVKTKWTRQPYASKPVPWNFKKKKKFKHKWIPWYLQTLNHPCSLVMAILQQWFPKCLTNLWVGIRVVCLLSKTLSKVSLNLFLKVRKAMSLKVPSW